MWTMLIMIGVFALLGGGAGYFMADAKLNDGDFRFEYYGSSTFGEMVDIRNISQYAIILGILLIVVGVILYAASVSKRSAASGYRYRETEGMEDAQLRRGALRYCANCGQPLTTGGEFCPYCGYRNVETVRRCSCCGSILDDDAIFCSNCGTKYQSQEENP